MRILLRMLPGGLLWGLLGAPASGAGANHLSLAAAEQQAEAASPLLHGADQQVAAASNLAEGQNAGFLPKLSLEGQYFYLTEVPSMKVGPTKLSFGAHNNYSIGPALTYTAFDGGARSDLYRADNLLTQSRQAGRAAARGQVLLGTRLVYIQAQLAQAQLEIAKQSLHLSQVQNHDLARQETSGAVSHLDLLTSNAEVANYEVKVAQSQGDLATALADLGAWIGRPGGDAAWELDPLEVDAARLTPAPSADGAGDGGHHPQIKAQDHLAESLEAAAEGQSAALWPTVKLQARSALEYPDGPVLERVYQNTFLVSASWDLVDWGAVDRSIAAKKADAAAARFQRDQMLSDLQRDLAKATARLKSLWEQRRAVAKLTKETGALAKLSYANFKYGKLSYSEVQTANIRLLDAEMRQAQIDAQLLIQYQNIRYLTGQEIMQ